MAAPRSRRTTRTRRGAGCWALRPPGTPGTRERSHSRTPLIRCGETATRSCKDARIVDVLSRKWSQETEYALCKDLWAFAGNRIVVRFQYESCDLYGQWWRSYGNENWEFAENGLMQRHEASINDVAISSGQRRIFGPRPSGDRSSIALQ